MTPATTKTDKVIVTNLSALNKKYGDTGRQKIQNAVQDLIAADKTRGLITPFFSLDDLATMQQFNAAPVTIRLSLLMINQVAITGVSGEVLTMIAQRLKKESPLSRTLMVTNCNGYNSYIPDDAAYDEVSYEIVSAPMKRGCAENAIVNGLLEMMDTAAARR